MTSWMRPSLAMSGLFLAGLVLLPAVRTQWSLWGPRRTVATFVEALRTGDEATLVKMVSPERARLLTTSPAGCEPAPGLRYVIDRVTVDGDSAVVAVTLTEWGHQITPEFSLQRTEDGRWLVVEIDRLDVLPPSRR